MFCTYCGKEFTRDTHLQRHVLSHSNIRPFHCSICHISFHRKDAAERHYITQHGKTGRVGHASCANCAKAKASCDNNHPCGRCRSNGISCDARRLRRASRNRRLAGHDHVTPTPDSDNGKDAETSETPHDTSNRPGSSLGIDISHQSTQTSLPQSLDDNLLGDHENMEPLTPGRQGQADIGDLSFSYPQIIHPGIEDPGQTSDGGIFSGFDDDNVSRTAYLLQTMTSAPIVSDGDSRRPDELLSALEEPLFPFPPLDMEWSKLLSSRIATPDFQVQASLGRDMHRPLGFGTHTIYLRPAAEPKGLLTLI
ncbi:hypothetical protein T440DRAFT_169073 [Plenodomus tracheiphilus IPT5]|uniref:C2H2-type domain-containing protein n=1 Tax=Plenodomus tracheiphilus IPT5 TaxID=1408161 RepID=A0A6A7B2N4_9PLEO|nr:hypothetical protein T440DRAFT_169073 [Plenodomus tracheiphilus IPT5]